MVKNNPIGVIDSGVGGLTVAKEIMRQLPNEEVIYVGDNARCPYGPRPVEEVRRFTLEMIDFLLIQNVKMIVVACNTATAAVINDIESYSVPIIGVISPGARSAVKNTKNLSVGVIGTVGTITSNMYEKELIEINPKLSVTSVACPKFVPIVESGQRSGFVVEKVVKESLEPFMSTNIDVLVLGCTHYPILEGVISKILGPKVKVVSSGDETAREVSTILSHSKMLRKSGNLPVHKFYTTGSRRMFKKIAVEWLGDIVDEIIKLKLV